MTDETRTVTLTNRSFPIPLLPPLANRIVLPLCHKLAPLVKRTGEEGGVFRPTTEEYDDTMEAIYHAIAFGTPDLTKEQFMLIPAKPDEHYQALLIVRLQTGGWTMAKPDDGAGEAKGAE